jgi:hypothetical protein
MRDFEIAALIRAAKTNRGRLIISIEGDASETPPPRSRFATHHLA